MCDVCDAHNACGIPNDYEEVDRDEEILLQCHECRRRINLYEEETHVWRIHDRQHPTGFRQIFLCPECNTKRMGGKLE